jgi:hypothetical protein
MVKKKTKNLQQLAHEVLEEKKKQKKVKKREKEEKKKMKGEKTKKPYTPKTHLIFAPSSSLSLSLPFLFFLLLSFIDQIQKPIRKEKFHASANSLLGRWS